MNLARQEKQLLDVSTQLDNEKTKLAEAYLFYTYMKDLFDVADGQLQNSFERKVEPAVIDTLKEKASQWKLDSFQYGLLKKNYSQLLTKYAQLDNTIESLHDSHRSLQRINVLSTNKFSNLKKTYDNLEIKCKNVTNMYTMQLDINTKLQKKLNNYKISKPQTIEVTNKMKPKRGSKKVKGNEVIRDGILNDDKKKEVMSPKENETEHITKLNEKSMIKKTDHIEKLTNDVASIFSNKTEDNKNVVTSGPSIISTTTTRNISLKLIKSPHNDIIPVSIPVSQALITPLLKIQKNVNVHGKQNKSLHPSVMNFVKHVSNKLSQNKNVSIKHTGNLTVSMPMKTKTTTMQPVVRPTEEKMTHSKSDEVDEYLEKEGTFDEEEKQDPPHIKDELDEHGLSRKSRAD